MAETYQIAHFFGGPIHGRTYSIPANFNEWKVVIAPAFRFVKFEEETGNRLIYEVLVYRRVLDSDIFILVEENGNGLPIV